MNTATVLALMLTLGVLPGRSLYSVVPASPDEPRPCKQENDPRCRRPWFSPDRGGYVRVETYEEGLARYWTIAQATRDAAQGKRWLIRYMLASMRYESGFRRDVHAGAAKGDRNRSWCLGQLMFGTNGERYLSKYGWKVKDLVGVDYAPTRRCLTIMAHYFTRAKNYCDRYDRPGNEHCVFAMYGGNQSLQNHPFILLRVSALGRLYKPHPLADEVRELLGLDEPVPLGCHLF